MRKKTSFIIYFVVLIFFSLSAESLADPGNKSKHQIDKNPITWSDTNTTKVTIRIDNEDHDTIKSYIKSNWSKKCPPGLAKKKNGCLPPGIAKKYHIGQRLPDDINWTQLPKDLLNMLNPAPRGYKYVQVDEDVLLISEVSKRVIDAVTLLSTTGN